MSHVEEHSREESTHLSYMFILQMKALHSFYESQAHKFLNNKCKIHEFYV